MSYEPQVSDREVREITEWLYVEAELLDDGRYRDWLKLLADDLRYLVPLRVTREREAVSDVIVGMAHQDDDWDAMEMRVLRLETDYAWAEDPPSRSRHYITNIRVAAGETAGEYTVKSNLLLYRTRGDSPAYDVLPGQRTDTLRRVDGELLLAKRVVMLDHTTVMTHNLALIM
jgi:3-phenylpropionate/cinnamic acid dioxygenase small subunit